MLRFWAPEIGLYFFLQVLISLKFCSKLGHTKRNNINLKRILTLKDAALERKKRPLAWNNLHGVSNIRNCFNKFHRLL